MPRKRPRRRAALLSRAAPLPALGHDPRHSGRARHSISGLGTLPPGRARSRPRVYSSPWGPPLHAWGWARPCLDTVGEGGGGRDTHCQGTLHGDSARREGNVHRGCGVRPRGGSQGAQLAQGTTPPRTGWSEACIPLPAPHLGPWGPGAWGSAGFLISTPMSRPQAGVRCQPPSPILAVFSLLDYSVNLPCSAFASPGFPSMWKSHWSSCHFPTMAS